MSTKESMLTTVDNPFDPFNQFDEWYAFDTRHGYNSLGLLARIAKTSPYLSELDQSEAIESAIDEIVTENVLGVSKKVTRNVA